MPKDEVTLALDGEVTPTDLARAASDLARLTVAIATEVAPGVRLEWIVSGLDHGSAMETVECRALDPREAEWVPRVIDGHERFGAAMERGVALPFQAREIHEVAESLRSLVRGRLIRVRFETADAGFTIAGKPLQVAERPNIRESTFGAVRGRVQTISKRGGTPLHALRHQRRSCRLLLPVGERGQRGDDAECVGSTRGSLRDREARSRIRSPLDGAEDLGDLRTREADEVLRARCDRCGPGLSR